MAEFCLKCTTQINQTKKGFKCNLCTCKIDYDCSTGIIPSADLDREKRLDLLFFCPDCKARIKSGELKPDSQDKALKEALAKNYELFDAYKQKKGEIVKRDEEIATLNNRVLELNQRLTRYQEQSTAAFKRNAKDAASDDYGEIINIVQQEMRTVLVNFNRMESVASNLAVAVASIAKIVQTLVP